MGIAYEHSCTISTVIDRNAITALEIPTGLPLVYQLNDDLKPIEHHYLEAPAKIGGAEAMDGTG
jgi:2,3-bisphosphoglycerate-dependent phosphoglycerate mutase